MNAPPGFSAADREAEERLALAHDDSDWGLYDQQSDSFCWGSWIIKVDMPGNYAIESALMVYRYALSLGFTRAHFEVRKDNVSVWRFHERFGTVKTGETEHEFLYALSGDAIAASLEKYSRYLPQGIQVIR